MEDYGVKRKILFFFAALILVPLDACAYEVETHMGLTKATVETYAQTTRKAFSEMELSSVVKGSAEEDESPRPLNHFFDPVYQRGLKVGVTWPASKVWAEDTRAQASFCAQNWCFSSSYFTYTKKLFGSPTDYSWDRAVYEYVHGDKNKGLQGLGHILHLLQDSAVPAHVRNDQHLNVWGIGDFDPYEQYSGKFTQGNIRSLGSIRYPKRPTLSEYFDSIAGFTNSHFVSKDTLFKNYDLPDLYKLELKGDGFAYDPILKKKIAIVRLSYNSFKKPEVKSVSLQDSNLDPESLVLSDSWSVLSKEAIENGVGVIDLFFQEVEKEKQTNELKKKNVSQWEIDVRNITLRLFGVSKSLYGSSLDTKDVSDLLDSQSAAAADAFNSSESDASSNTVVDNPIEPAIQEKPPAKQKAKSVQSETLPPSEETPSGGESATTTSPAVPLTDTAPTHRGSGGGGSGAAPTPSTEPQSVSISAPVITAPVENAFLSTTSVEIAGTADTDMFISLLITSASGATTTATTTSSAGGTWSVPISLFEGTTTISVIASDQNSNASPATVRVFSSDVTPPSVSTFSLRECDHSLVVGGSCAGGLQATPSLSATSSDISYYHYVVDGSIVGTVTALGSITLTAGTHAVAIAAYDAAGNGATSSAATIISIDLSLVINEVGWMGTQASASDHWIELFNNSSYTIDMSTVRLATDGWQTSVLSGTLGGTNMYLVEKSEVVSSITASHIDGNLSFTSTPAQLRLEYTAGGYATTTLDATPVASACGSVWCSGTDDSERRSMERTRPDVAGTMASNWNSNNTFAVYGLDSNGVKINGSLMEPNSRGNHNLVSYTCDPPYTSFYTEGGYYIPASSNCRYYSPTILGQFHYAAVFAGTVGSSTDYNSHSTGSVVDTVENGDVVPAGYDVRGQDLFVAVFTIPSGGLGTTYLNLFMSYFTTGANPPPMGNYGIFRFKYGP